MLRWAWIFLAMAVGSGFMGSGSEVGALPPFQWAAFLFTVLFLILLILGSPHLKNLI